MNIFLLFLTTILMIGYYTIYSPSQNLPGANIDSVAENAKLQALVERVVAQHNDFLIHGNDQDYIENDGITSCYFCVSETNSLVSCDNAKTQIWVTNSNADKIPLPDKLDATINFIRQNHPHTSLLGIYDSKDGNDIVYTVQAPNGKSIASNLLNSATQKDCKINSAGQVIYITEQNYNPGGGGNGGGGGGGDEPAPIDCYTYCVKELGYINGEPNDRHHCKNVQKEVPTCLCYTAETANCPDTEMNLNCYETPFPLYQCKSCDEICRHATGCMCGDTDEPDEPDPEEPINPNGDEKCLSYTHLGYKEPGGNHSEIANFTLQSRQWCGKCQKLVKDSDPDHCTQWCVPKNPKYESVSSECFSNSTGTTDRLESTSAETETEASDTTEPDRTSQNYCDSDFDAWYFGFHTLCQEGTGGNAANRDCSYIWGGFTDAENEESSNPVQTNIIDHIVEFLKGTSNLETNLKFNCMHCEYGVDFELSHPFYTVVCKKQGDSGRN